MKMNAPRSGWATKLVPNPPKLAILWANLQFASAILPLKHDGQVHEPSENSIRIIACGNWCAVLRSQNCPAHNLKDDLLSTSTTSLQVREVPRAVVTVVKNVSTGNSAWGTFYFGREGRERTKWEPEGRRRSSRSKRESVQLLSVGIFQRQI